MGKVFPSVLLRNAALNLSMGKWKCLWCSKVIEGESFMDLVMTSTNNEQPHAWENITLLEEETDMANKLLPSLHS
jgi:hypothetical protein